MISFTKTRCILSLLLTLPAFTGSAQDGVLQFVFTSDVHYGITRPHFRGSDSVPATVVNEAMIAAINHLPQLLMPCDNGVGSGERINDVDAVLITGDIANREETGIQPAAVSWRQFEADYYHKITTKGKDRRPTALWFCAGNHDVSNAIGFWRPAEPATDASSMAAIYNRMIVPAHPRTAADYNYAVDKIHYSKDIAGVHLLFVNLWPDSAEPLWIEQYLKRLQPAIPVLLFTHSMPEVEARFFTNPNGQHTINSTDKFENLLPEIFRDGQTVKDTALYEERELATFLVQHPQIKAWFHGHNNWNEFYNWQAPGKNISLPCFRVDSPMKGRVSAKDETRLSFQLISIDTRTKTMTVRECRWNTVPGNPAVLQWGEHLTMAL